MIARLTAVLVGLLALASPGALLTPAPATDDGSINILVLKEHGVGTPGLAQPYLDKFVAIAKQQNGWPAAKGQYLTNRAAAEAFINSHRPDFAILSLGAFLAFQPKYGLDVIGQVDVKLVGGRQYFLVSRQSTDLAGCLQQPLASDHLDDSRFIEKVVAGSAFRLADFTLVQTQRPLQTIRKVLNDEARCALIDDAQLSDLSHIPGTDGIRVVWKSKELPPMVVVAFPSAPAPECARFRENLPDLCDDAGKTICAEVGIDDLRPAREADYADVLTAYGK